MKKKLIALNEDRVWLLDEAQAALEAGEREKYQDAMNRVGNVNDQIADVQRLLAEQQRRMDEAGEDPAVEKDKAADRGSALLQGREIKVSVNELRRGVMRNSVTLAPTLVEPVGAGLDIRSPVGGGVSRIIDQVRTIDLEGMGGFVEPYLVTPQEAQAGVVETLSGTARTATDPTFAYAELKPYEVDVTTFVDRNIKRLSPADYFAKIYELAMEAMRRKICTLIYNGDGAVSPVFYGLKTAKNRAGQAIYSTVDATALDENVLDALYYGYGDDEGAGENAQLYLNKQDLKALGAIRNSDKQRVFRVNHQGANYGTIEDGGAAYGYNIAKDLSTFAAAKADAMTMAYGDPQNYELAFFGEMTVRIDESAKAVERMLTILGDAMVGGNLIRHNGFTLLTKKAAG